jgi:hypothetical protein
MHVNFLPWTVFTCPLVAHLAPAFTAAVAGEAKEALRKVRAINAARIFFMPNRVLIQIGFVSSP